MKNHHHTSAFTLVEVLVAAGVVVVLMGVLLAMTDQTQRLVKSTSSKVEQFQEARVAFESMTRRLAQATLNTYWEYDNPTNPTKYLRSAELRFISGPTSELATGGSNGKVRPGHCVFFHAPNGLVDNKTQFGALDNVINVWGYFIEIGTDEDTMPTFMKTEIQPRKRFRLMEAMQPTENLKTYEFQGITGSDASAWFAPLVTGTNRPVRVLAENVVALIILPRLSRADEELWKKDHTGKTPVLATKYKYYSNPETSRQNPNGTDPFLNTKNQLPPVVQVVMFAIDEPSARTLEDRYGNDPYLGVDYSRNYFRDPAYLEAPDGELAKMEKLLIDKHASYRVFSTNVSIRGAKWSRSQVN